VTLLATTLVLSAVALADAPKPDPPPTAVLLGASSAYHSEPGCLPSVKAITYYRRQYTASRNTMGLPGAVPRAWYPCPAAKRRAIEWRDKAWQAKRAYAKWHEYHYDWRSWLPRGWYGIGSCETGYGGDPNWQHNSGTYQGAFGFAVSSWDSFVGSADPKAGPYPSEAYLATPRQQYEVALAIYRRYGLTGWGCRGAFYGA